VFSASIDVVAQKLALLKDELAATSGAEFESMMKIMGLMQQAAETVASLRKAQA